MSSFSAQQQAQIIMPCFALHNFICESQLHDKEFKRCDEYMPQASNNEDVTEDVDEEEGGNEVTMNTICDRIATSLANARATWYSSLLCKPFDINNTLIYICNI
jgi:hypothetical protein